MVVNTAPTGLHRSLESPDKLDKIKSLHSPNDTERLVWLPFIHAAELEQVAEVA